MFGIATGAFVDERDEWPRAVDRAVDEGWRVVELTAITESLYESLRVYLADEPRLDSFERVSVHAPVSVVDVDLTYDVVFHPDVYRHEDSVAGLGGRALFENMDVAKTFGRTVEDLEEIFRRFPDAGFCLDVAHVWTNDTSLTLGHDLLDAFGHRLRQLHVSGIEPDGTHRPTTNHDLGLYEPLLARCRHVPQILEAELARSDASF